MTSWRGATERLLEVAFAFLLLHRSILVEVDDAGGAFALRGGHHFLDNLFDGVGFALDGSGEGPAT